MPGRSVCFMTMAVVMCVGLATPSRAQVTELYRAHMSGQEVVPPSGQPGRVTLAIQFDVGPCTGDENGVADVCIEHWDVSGTPVEFRLGVAQPGENADSLVVLWTLDAEQLESCVSAQVAWPECLDWTGGGVYAVLTSTAYPEGELRGQFAFVPQPTIETSWGSVKRRWKGILIGG